jgi:hypothetical protein
MKWFIRTGHVDCRHCNPKTRALHSPIGQHAVETSQYRAASDAFVAQIKSTTAISLTRSGLGEASREFESHGIPVLANLISAVCSRWHQRRSSKILGSACLLVATVVFAIFVTGCAAYGPYHANTSGEPFNSVRGPKDGRSNWQ